MSRNRQNALGMPGLGSKVPAAMLLLALLAPFAFAQDGAAKVETMNGQVSVLHDSSPWALHAGDAVQPRQIIITGSDGYALLRVADGSTFEVFPNARVVFRNTQGNWSDLLEVFLGRVKVHIQKIGGQPNYNKVRTPTAVVSVRGTIFDVVVEDEDATTLVSVEEGQVGVRHAILAPFNDKLINAGESIRVFKNQPLSANTIDKTGFTHGVLRAAADAMYQIMYRTHGVGGVPTGGGPSGGGGGTGGGNGTGEKGPSGNGNGGAPPPPPPPPGH
ncbi:MAG TPA: FecR domain-containing protein [Bryobacteraceae bacterium]|nr:FecR domain-containing protein [Bryobacteraceae bacterium]